MGEIHNVAGPPRAEPMPAGRVGARIRIPLTGTPSPRWSSVLTARLSAALTGHPAVGHLDLVNLVQGADLVLEGVEAAEAERLGPAISAALAAANRREPGSRPDDRPAMNMSQEQADAIARQIKLEFEHPRERQPPRVKFPGR